MLATYDIVTVATGFEDHEIRGQRGYVIGEVTDDQIAVFIYDLERVWCLHPSDVTATREVDREARDAPRGPVIRVNSNGDIIG